MAGSGLGNGNAKSGNKGSNHNFEHRNLLSLGNIAAFVGAGATEATLQLVLTAIQSGSEFEARLVEDALSVTWLEVRTWNTSGGTWNPPLYYPAGSNTPGAPTLPVVYINNSAVLATIASNTTGLATEATAATLATEVTLGSLLTAFNAEDFATQTTLAALLAAFNAEDFATETTQATLATELTLAGIKTQTDLLNFIATALEVTITGTVPLPTGASTETTLAALLTELQLKADLTETQPVSQANTVRTAGLLVVSGIASTIVAAGARSVTFFNQGPTAATVAGGVLDAGESISFDAGAQGDTLAAIPYVTIATGVLKIATVV